MIVSNNFFNIGSEIFHAIWTFLLKSDIIDFVASG